MPSAVTDDVFVVPDHGAPETSGVPMPTTSAALDIAGPSCGVKAAATGVNVSSTVRSTTHFRMQEEIKMAAKHRVAAPAELSTMSATERKFQAMKPDLAAPSYFICFKCKCEVPPRPDGCFEHSALLHTVQALFGTWADSPRKHLAWTNHEDGGCV